MERRDLACDLVGSADQELKVAHVEDVVEGEDAIVLEVEFFDVGEVKEDRGVLDVVLPEVKGFEGVLVMNLGHF